jgi:hypothetical protein
MYASGMLKSAAPLFTRSEKRLSCNCLLGDVSYKPVGWSRLPLEIVLALQYTKLLLSCFHIDNPLAPPIPNTNPSTDSILSFVLQASSSTNNRPTTAGRRKATTTEDTTCDNCLRRVGQSLSLKPNRSQTTDHDAYATTLPGAPAARFCRLAPDSTNRSSPPSRPQQTIHGTDPKSWSRRCPMVCQQ